MGVVVLVEGEGEEGEGERRSALEEEYADHRHEGEMRRTCGVEAP